MSTSEERYISPRRLKDFKTLLEDEYKIDKHTNQIGSLLNRDAKNLLKITATSKTISGVTFTVNDDDGTVTVNGTNTGTGSATFVIVPNKQAILIPDGDYQFLGCPQGGSSDTFDLRWFHYSLNASAYDTGSGAVIHKSGNATDSNIAIVVKSGVTVNNVTFKPMLCTVEDYSISSEFVPYAPTNRELYLNQQKSFGKLVYQTVHNSSYTSTYSMKTSDFGDGPAGLYMIYIISWAASPTISIYSMAYSGNVTSQSKLAKIFGADANISLTGDTVTYKGAGKIQIVAMNTF